MLKLIQQYATSLFYLFPGLTANRAHQVLLGKESRNQDNAAVMVKFTYKDYVQKDKVKMERY